MVNKKILEKVIFTFQSPVELSVWDIWYTTCAHIDAHTTETLKMQVSLVLEEAESSTGGEKQ